MAEFADWALNEECNQFDECGGYHAFIARNKAVFQVEYTASVRPRPTCARSIMRANFDGILKLSARRWRPCPASPAGSTSGAAVRRCSGPTLSGSTNRRRVLVSRHTARQLRQTSASCVDASCRGSAAAVRADCISPSVGERDHVHATPSTTATYMSVAAINSPPGGVVGASARAANRPAPRMYNDELRGIWVCHDRRHCAPDPGTRPAITPRETPGNGRVGNRRCSATGSSTVHPRFAALTVERVHARAVADRERRVALGGCVEASNGPRPARNDPGCQVGSRQFGERGRDVAGDRDEMIEVRRRRPRIH